MIRLRLKPEEAIHLGFILKKKDKDGSNPKYSLDNNQSTELAKFRNKERPLGQYSATDNLGNMLTVEEVCEMHGLDFSTVVEAKLVAHTKRKAYNIKFKFDNVLEEDKLSVDLIKSVLSKDYPSIPLAPNKTSSKTCDRLVMTDIHVGMDPNPEGTDMYNQQWDKKTLFHDLKIILNKIQSLKTSDTIIIEDLGDFLDGWSKQTTRGGHNLPQNMTNIEMFQTGVEFKLCLLSSLSVLYDRVILYQVNNDNHAGDFASIVNYTVKLKAESSIENVEVHNMDKFMSHYKIGKHVNIISHGKDKIHMKTGMKPFMGPAEKEKINVYIDMEVNKGKYIRFAKGDSHQYITDFSSSHKFSYHNYPAMSPGSGYVTTNFKPGLRGVVFESFEINRRSISVTPIWLN